MAKLAGFAEVRAARTLVLPDAEWDRGRPLELRALVDRAEAQLQAREDFIAVAAHELRNPMTPLLAQVQHLLRQARRDGSDPGLTKGLERLELFTLHYIRRASTLLEISRLNAGLLHLEPSEVDLGAGRGNHQRLRADGAALALRAAGRDRKGHRRDLGSAGPRAGIRQHPVQRPHVLASAGPSPSAWRATAP